LADHLAGATNRFRKGLGEFVEVVQEIPGHPVFAQEPTRARAAARRLSARSAAFCSFPFRIMERVTWAEETSARSLLRRGVGSDPGTDPGGLVGQFGTDEGLGLGLTLGVELASEPGSAPHFRGSSRRMR